MGRPPTDKRERLVTAAIVCFHRHGYARTSIADVAREAGVAAGNVFYYFKTKEDLARGVVDVWCVRLAGYLLELEPAPDAWRRIEGFVDQAGTMADLYVAWGCPFAGLARDLRQEGGTLASEAGRIYAVQAAWLAGQFRSLGFPPAQADNHVGSVMTAYHGAILLAHARADTTVITREGARLKRWLHWLHRSSRRAPEGTMASPTDT